MSKEDRKQIFDYLLLLSQETTGEAERSLSIWNECCYSQLSVLVPGLPPVRPGTRLYPALKESHKQVEDFISATGFGSLTTAERKTLYLTLASLLVYRARHLASKTTAPLGMRLVLQSSADLPSLFDAAFPGYLRSGLGRRILTNMTACIVSKPHSRSL